jgi:4-amino-4-deoxy-L-arabinose transferase-like glycosyltransferase
VRGGLFAAATVCLVTLLIAIFESSMADWPSGFLLLLVLPLTALLFFACCVWSATQLLRIRQDGAKFASPFLICAATLALLLYAPLQQVYLQRDFYWHRAGREKILARVEAGELKPNVDYNENLIALSDAEPHVSAGNDIVVDQADEGTYVLFLTSRGLKHYFSGFLHVPPGGDPKKFFEFDDKPPTQLVPYGKDWYFVAN